MSITSQDSFEDIDLTSNGLKPTISYQQSMAPEDEQLPKPSQRRMLMANAPEWKTMLIGLVSSVVNGATFPVFAIIFGEVC